MSEAEIRAYVIADNKLAENAGWNRDLLALEFQYLSTLEVDYRPDPHRVRAARDRHFPGRADYGATADEPDPADRVPEPLPAIRSPVSGDVWHIGSTG